jgi:glutamate dehydrogenase (NADP+)
MLRNIQTLNISLETSMGVKCDIALPCATQNELNEEEAKTLVANGYLLWLKGLTCNYARRSYCVPESKIILLQEKQQMQVVLQLQD